MGSCVGNVHLGVGVVHLCANDAGGPGVRVPRFAQRRCLVRAGRMVAVPSSGFPEAPVVVMQPWGGGEDSREDRGRRRLGGSSARMPAACGGLARRAHQARHQFAVVEHVDSDGAVVEDGKGEDRERRVAVERHRASGAVDQRLANEWNGAYRRAAIASRATLSAPRNSIMPLRLCARRTTSGSSTATRRLVFFVKCSSNRNEV
jgi:hypothetical protein